MKLFHFNTIYSDGLFCGFYYYYFNVGFSFSVYLLLWCSLLALLVVAACIDSVTVCVLMQGLGLVVMAGGERENGRMWLLVWGSWGGEFFF
jgi:hypothetical protein